MPVPVSAFSHVRLTVTDIERSRAFYDSVFGFDVFLEAPPADADEATKKQMAFLYGGVIYSFAGGLLGLRPVASGSDRYDEDRVGLDHLSFRAQRQALDDAVTLLDSLGIAHEEIKDIGAAHILQFRDPDNVALELFAPK
jgi:glyoxylase I family protein